MLMEWAFPSISEKQKPVIPGHTDALASLAEAAPAALGTLHKASQDAAETLLMQP